jgi:hypothetical protein
MQFQTFVAFDHLLHTVVDVGNFFRCGSETERNAVMKVQCCASFQLMKALVFHQCDLIFRRTVLCVRLEINNCTICQADFPVRLADPRPGEPTDDA